MEAKLERAMYWATNVDYQILRMHVDFASDCLFIGAMVIGIAWAINNWNINR